jgi:transcription elongation GreA/GreB family factor
MDGGSWRFKQADIDEESRRRGMGSEPELPLSDLDLGSDLDIDLTEFQIGVAPADLAAPSVNDMSSLDTGSDDQILIDERNTPPSPSGSSSTIIGMHSSSKGKKPSDSDVRLVPDKPNKSASDSDVRLGPASSSASGIEPPRIGRAASDSDVTLVNEEAGSSREVQSVSHDDADPNATLLQPSPMLGSSDEIDSFEGTSDSDFELTPSSVIDALEPESGSDFELTALDGSSDEFDATPLRGPSDSDVTGAAPSTSGVNLGRPSDSGINLQAVGGFEMQADSIELAPLDDEEPARPAAKPAAQAPKAAPKPAAKKPVQEEKVDLSATALPVRSEKDIFEDTDFDVDVEAIDSSEDDRTVQLEARSDFDVEDDSDSASEVFAVDENEEDVDANAATAMGPAVMEDEGEFEESVSGETPSAWDSEEAAAPAAAPGRSAAASPAFVSAGGPGPEWGGLWVGLLGFTSVLVLLGAFMGMDLVRNLYYFQGNSPASGLIQQIAGLF